QVPERHELAAAGVVEEVLGPAPFGRGRDLDLDELEAHGLGVEGVGGTRIPGGEGSVVERYGETSFPREATPGYILAVLGAASGRRRRCRRRRAGSRGHRGHDPDRCHPDRAPISGGTEPVGY